MIRIYKLALALILALGMLVQTSFASGFITLSGKTDSLEDIAVLVLKEGTNINDIKRTDIAYVTQERVNNDGSFSIILPFESVENYLVRSNKDINISTGERNKTLYVSAATGSDTNGGETSQSPLKTLDAAYGKLYMASEIIILDDMELTLPNNLTGSFTIKGNEPSVKLALPAEISISCNLCIDNITLVNKATIYANGFKFKIGSDVTSADSDNRLTVYGGKKSADYIGNTDLELLGGKYQTIYGGCNNGTVTGNTNVIFGGNSNIGEGIDDGDSTTLSPCYVYGGSNNAPVIGKTNVTLEGNAVTKALVGAGKGTNGTVQDTNIYINGGKVAHVYGGSLNTELTDCNTHITMTGGLVEGIFGGSSSKNLKGNTYVTILGGDISRRLYTGCYNEVGFTWSSSYYVSGTTTLAIGPEAKLVTYTELSSGNKKDCGIYSGSRVSKNFEDEINTLIYLDGCYEKLSGKVGCTINGGIQPLTSKQDYTVIAGEGGIVQGTTQGGVVKVIPNAGYIGVYGENRYEKEDTISFTDKKITVNFEPKPYNINSLNASRENNSVVGSVNIMGSKESVGPQLIVAVFDAETNMLMSCSSQSAEVSAEKPFSLNCNLESGKKYVVKATIWDAEMRPLTSYYTIEL